VFRYSTTLKLRETDAAGVAFFASYFAIAHDVYEAWLTQQGAGLHTWLDSIHLPIVHASADYSAPLRLGDPFEVEMTCLRRGERSFTLTYHLIDASRQTLARLKTIHVSVLGGESTELPKHLQDLLDKIQAPIDEARS
jgi:1,4-dihydroxy-2-naphthoyl-CoA hydrolase